MGLLDGLMPGYTPAPVNVEGALGRWRGGRTPGGFALAGGEIILTQEYLVFTPWDMTRTREFLVKLLSKAGVPYVGTADKLLSQTKLLEPIAVSLSEIAEVTPMGRASVTKPPWARIVFTNGKHLDVGIVAGVRDPNFSPANNVAFDDWLAKLRAQHPSLKA